MSQRISGLDAKCNSCHKTWSHCAIELDDEDFITKITPDTCPFCGSKEIFAKTPLAPRDGYPIGGG